MKDDTKLRKDALKYYDEWRKADKIFRFHWWNPVFLWRYFVVTRKAANEVRRFLNHD